MKSGRSLSAKMCIVPRRLQFLTRPSPPASQSEQRIRKACAAQDVNCACMPQSLRTASSLSSGLTRPCFVSLRSLIPSSSIAGAYFSFQALTWLRSQSAHFSTPSPVFAEIGMISIFGLSFFARAHMASKSKSK